MGSESRKYFKISRREKKTIFREIQSFTSSGDWDHWQCPWRSWTENGQIGLPVQPGQSATLVDKKIDR